MDWIHLAQDRDIENIFVSVRIQSLDHARCTSRSKMFEYAEVCNVSDVTRQEAKEIYFLFDHFSYIHQTGLSIPFPPRPVNFKPISDPLKRKFFSDRQFCAILSIQEVLLSELLLFINGLPVKER
jgi:hypothetical protein